MKLVELKCPACNGTVKLDPEHPGEAVCEYCKTRYMVEQESGDEYKLGNFGSRSVGDLPPHSFQEVKPRTSLPQETQKVHEEERKRFVIIAVAAAVVFVAAIAVSARGSAGKKSSAKATSAVVETAIAAEPTQAPAKPVVWSQGMEQVILGIYGRTPDQVSEQELMKLRYLELKPGLWDTHTDRKYFRVSYGLDGDLGADGEMAIHTFEGDLPAGMTMGWELFNDFSCLRALKGLETLSLHSTLKPGDLEGLEHLRTLGVQYISPDEVAALVDDPGQLTGLIYDYNQTSLEGIGQFTGLERLELHGSDDLTDIKDLASLKNLKSLSMEYCPNLTDFSVFFTMSGLTELRLDLEHVKDISFVNSMPQLERFALDDSQCISIAPLSSCENLKELSLTSNYELPDYSAITGLTGLESLTIDKYSNQPDPDLSGMTNMKTLTLAGFNGCSFLRSMGGLTDLTIAGYCIDDPGAFSGLTQLERLKGTKSWEYLNSVDFLANLPALIQLDLSGTTFYTDISALLNKEGLVSLNLNGASMEINFSRLTDNPGLLSLSMNGVKLYKNVKADRYGGISMVNWDDVALDAELGFLSHYPGLTDLSLADNKLAQIQPAATLPLLETLDISKNYVTDLNPLAGLEHLKKVDGRENPVSNWQVVGEKVTVTR